MKRHHLAAVTALTIAVTAARAEDAAAQEAPGTPVAPPAATAPIAAAVRVHVRTFKNKGTARLYIHRTDGSYTLVCASPCTADVPGNSELRVTLANNDDEPHTFVLPADLGSEVDLEVRPASLGPLIGSIVTMGVGGAFVLSGLLFIALSDVHYGSVGNTTSTQRDISTTYKTTGYVMIGLGAAAAIAGFVWFLSRSHEPQVFDSPYQQPQVYGRRETLLGDVALAKPRDPTSVITDAPLPFTPLHYGFSF
jgi:hypothetical protein